MSNQLSRAKNYLISPGVTISSNFTGKLKVNLAGNINYRSAQYLLQSRQNQNAGPTTLLNQTATLDAYYQQPLKITFSTNVYYTHYGGSWVSFSEPYTLWNATLARQLFRQNQGELRFQAFDLPNQN